jgi:glycerol kinase
MKTLVIDVGTSGLRAAIVHDDASVSNLAYEEFSPHSPAGGLVEFDADAMWTAVLRVCTAAIGDSTVDAVGITNQRASTIAWRASTGRPIGRSIGWQDLRTVGDCIMHRMQNNLAFAPNQLATKAAWMLSNYIVDAGERASDDIRIGTVDCWLTWKLTNGAVFATDTTNAAVTGLTVAAGTEWNQHVLDILGISAHQLPHIVPTSGVVGHASALPGSPPITALVGDQQGSLVGQGCLTVGSAKITFGTGGMLDMFVGERAPKSATRTSGGTFPIVAFSTDAKVNYGVEAIMLSAGTNIEWLRDDMGLIDSPAHSGEIAAQVPNSGGVVFVPALLGLGTPHWDYGARGALFGLTRGSSRAHIVRSVLEGVAHRGVDLVDAAETDSGLRIDELRIDGGMSRNPVFVQALADAAQRPVRVSPVTEATTLGAGFLAGVAVGQWSTLEEAANAISGARTVDPLGEPGVSRQQWSEAISRSRAWIPDLSALDF